jgi:LPS export ABC transporter protein LptC
MKRHVVAGLATLAIIGCGSEQPVSNAPAPSPPPDAVTQNAAEEALQGASMTVAGLDLYMHDDAFTGQDTAEPTFWVHADQGELTGDESLWTLTTTQAVIYRDDEDDMRLNAKQGWFDQVRNTAQLSGEVTIDSGPLRISTEQVDWDNTLGTVTSENETELRNGTTRLTAIGFTMSPDTGGIHLYQPRGTITFGEL